MEAVETGYFRIIYFVMDKRGSIAGYYMERQQ